MASSHQIMKGLGRVLVFWRETYSLAAAPVPLPARPPGQVILVVQQPERQEGEDAAAYGHRLRNERVLALNPNYAVE